VNISRTMHAAAGNMMSCGFFSYCWVKTCHTSW